MREYKILVIGSGGADKSALTVQFAFGGGVYDDPTIEDSYRKLVEVDGLQCMLDISDATNREEFSAMRDQYIKIAQGFVLVYSITSQSTFDDLSNTKEQILRVKDRDHVPMVLVGNNCHQEDERVVSRHQGQDLVRQWGNCTFMESSVKTKTNISEIFFDLVRQINAQIPEKLEERQRCCIVL